MSAGALNVSGVYVVVLKGLLGLALIWKDKELLESPKGENLENVISKRSDCDSIDLPCRVKWYPTRRRES